MPIENPNFNHNSEIHRVLNVEWASDFLRSRGWRIAGMPGSSSQPLDGMYAILNATDQDTGIRFRPYLHTDETHGVWCIQGRAPSLDVYADNAWQGRGWEPFNDIDTAISEMEYYRMNGLNFQESPSEAAQRRRK